MDLSMWANYRNASQWGLSRWTIRVKVNKDLQQNPYDGTGLKHRDWPANIVNHLLSSNQGWGKVTWLVQRLKEPITYNLLAATNRNGTGLSVDWVWLARALYTVLFNHATPTQRRGLTGKAGQGQELNGLEPGGSCTSTTKVDTSKSKPKTEQRISYSHNVLTLVA